LIAGLVAKKLDIRLDRDARRRKIVMIKWFEENWSAVEPLLSNIVLEDQSIVLKYGYLILFEFTVKVQFHSQKRTLAPFCDAHLLQVVHQLVWDPTEMKILSLQANCVNDPRPLLGTRPAPR
jgi:hypothetical protein